MKKLFVLGLLIAGMTISSAFAAVNVASSKSTQVVSLKNTTAQYMMVLLGLVDQTPGVAVPTPALGGEPLALPKGVDSVKPGKSDDTLIIKGDKAAVNELKATIGKLDITPKQIQIKAESFELDPDLAAQLVPDDSDATFPSIESAMKARGDAAKALKDKLTALGISPVNTPIISTLDRMSAKMEVMTNIPYTDAAGVKQSIKAGTSFSVLPRINADKSISVTLNVSLSSADCSKVPPEQRTHSVTTCRRVPSGEPAIISGALNSCTKPTLVIITATVVD